MKTDKIQAAFREATVLVGERSVLTAPFYLALTLAMEQVSEIQSDAGRAQTELRDTFAAAALTGILSANEDITHRLPDGTRTSVGVARLAYGMADAMLAAREGK